MSQPIRGQRPSYFSDRGLSRECVLRIPMRVVKGD